MSETRKAVTVECHAARELLDDPRWAEKIRRALSDSEAGRVRPLNESRTNLGGRRPAP